MRILFLFLLYSTFCFGQKIEDYAKVTAYRLVEESTDAPCTIVRFVKAPEYGTVFTAVSDDNEMIVKLFKLRKDCKKWRKKEHYCSERGIGYIDMIDNMFVFEGKLKNDTLFTTANNKSIVFSKNNVQYIAPNNDINKALKGDMKDFFLRDFRDDIWSIHEKVNDSISPDKVLYKKKSIYNNLNIEDIYKSGILTEADTLYSNNDTLVKKKYVLNQNAYTFDYDKKLESIQIFHLADFYLDGIVPGDAESKLDKYPNSIKHQFPNGTKYEEIKNNYEYSINVEGKKSTITFQVRKKIIESITLTFY